MSNISTDSIAERKLLDGKFHSAVVENCSKVGVGKRVSDKDERLTEQITLKSLKQGLPIQLIVSVVLFCKDQPAVECVRRSDAPMELVIDDVIFSKVSDVFRCRKNGCDHASRVNSRRSRSFFDQSIVVGCVYWEGGKDSGKKHTDRRIKPRLVIMKA